MRALDAIRSYSQHNKQPRNWSLYCLPNRRRYWSNSNFNPLLSQSKFSYDAVELSGAWWSPMRSQMDLAYEYGHLEQYKQGAFLFLFGQAYCSLQFIRRGRVFFRTIKFHSTEPPRTATSSFLDVYTCATYQSKAIDRRYAQRRKARKSNEI